MSALIAFLTGVVLIHVSARAFEERTPHEDSDGKTGTSGNGDRSGGWDALLFLLCLVGILAAKRRDENDE